MSVLWAGSGVHGMFPAQALSGISYVYLGCPIKNRAMVPGPE